MKLKFTTILLLAVLLFAACSSTFPLVEDTRQPTPTWTPWIIGPVNDTPTPEATVTAEPGHVCEIKGNVASGKIYHMPGDANYTQTKVQLERGDRWFCSEKEAQEAGFRKAKR